MSTALLLTPVISVPLYQDGILCVTIPEHQLAPGSLAISASKNTYFEWTNQEHGIHFELMQKIAEFWGTRPFLVYGDESPTVNKTFAWEIVPYNTTSNALSRFWQQFQVAWRVIFGGTPVDAPIRAKQIEHYEGVFDHLVNTANKVEEVVEGLDPFCDPNVIQKQQVFEGKKIRVLYNYAPIGFGEEKLHFLFTPKAHRRDFRELTREEYEEASTLSQYVIKRLAETGLIYHSYLYHKTGKDAGQTVDHWHLHLVVTRTPGQDWMGKIQLLWNMVWGPSRLPPDQLANKVSQFTVLLAERE